MREEEERVEGMYEGSAGEWRERWRGRENRRVRYRVRKEERGGEMEERRVEGTKDGWREEEGRRRDT